ALNALVWGAEYPLWALEVEAVAHIALAAIGVYLFVRWALGLGSFPALVGAIVFGFGGYLTGFPLEQVTLLATSAWLPWLLLAIHGLHGARSPSRRLASVVLGALALAMTLLAGFPQTALYVLYLGAAYTLLQLGKVYVSRGPWRANLVASVLLFTLGAGLAAAQLLPTMHFIAESSRGLPDYQFVRSGLSWEELATVFLPRVVGSSPLYGGIVTLLLLPLGMWRRMQRIEWRFWAGVALVGLLLALGGSSFFLDLFYLGAPGLDKIRSHERALLLWSWSIALLAAWGASVLFESFRDGRVRARLRRYVYWLALFLPVLLLPWLTLWTVRALVVSRISINLEVLDGFFTRYSFFFVLFVLGWAFLFWASRYRPTEAGGRKTEAGRRRPEDGGRKTLVGPKVDTPWSSVVPGVALLALLVWDLFSITRATHIGSPTTEALRPRTEVVEALAAWQAVAPARVAVVGEPVPHSNDGMRWGFPLLSGNEPLRLTNSQRFLQEAPPWNQLQALAAGYVVADSNLAERDPAAYELLASAANPNSYLLHVRPPMPYAW
ncbi:MAG: hypothetical protein ACRDIB_11975, partial [Ardenticatenaceae bacterium]